MSTRHGLFLALVFCMQSPIFAQQTGVRAEPDGAGGSPAPASQVRPLTSHPPVAANEPEGLIHLDVAVTDRAGKPISGMDRRDFTLFDNGQSEQIVSFHAFGGINARPNPPTAVILLIDTRDVPRAASDVHQAVEKFLRQNGGRLASASPTVGDVPARGVTSEAQGKFAQSAVLAAAPHRGSDGNCIHFDGGKAESGQKAGRKLLLWVGPGVIGSGAYPEPTDPADRQDIFDKIYWFSTLLREARVTLYTFSVGDNNPGISSQPGYWGLRDPWEGFLSGVKSTDQATAMDLYKKVLAVESGGRAPLTENDLGKQMDACLQEASTFYTLTFDPPLARHAAEYHDLKVEVREAGLTARTMTGYYDEPFYDDAANPEIRRVTAAELEQIAGSARGESDGEVQVEADLKGFVPLKRSDIMVSYGPVAIRGKMYILPVRSVHIWRKRTVPVLEEWHAGFNTWEPYTTMLNQFTFEDYHMFRVESRLLTGSSTPIAPGSTTPP